MTTLNPKDRQTIERSVLLGNLSEDLVEAMIGVSSLIPVPRANPVFLQGDPARHIFVVLEGWVKLYRTTPAGDEAVVGIFTSGQSFGEAVALQGFDYPVAAEAVTDSRLLRLSGKVLLQMMKERSEFCPSMLAACYTHLHSLVQQVEALKSHTGPQRVAEFLVHLALEDDGSAAVTLPYDKVLIAGRLGMQPESLSRAFARLRQEGVEVRQNMAVIKDVQRLRCFAEGGRGAEWRATAR